MEQQKQAQEKLALLDDAKRQLADAFKALAADALKSSNTSFLELAKTQLEKFQESAKGDLDKRQTAIDELVKPVKESLGKVDAKLQEIEKSRIEAYSGLTEQVQLAFGNAEGPAQRDGQSGQGVAASAGPRPLGRNPTAPRGRNGRHVGPLRFRRAAIDRHAKTAGCGPTWS